MRRDLATKSIESDYQRRQTMDQSRPTVIEVIIKASVTHTITYFVMGLLAFTIFDYGHLYAETSLNLLMRQTSEPLVMAGPLFQPIRGILFGIVFFLLRDILFGRKNGWLVLWIVLVVVGIISPFGPTPGSIEGMIYTIVPLGIQLVGLPEVILQALILSVVLVYWVNHPEKKWLNWVMGIAFVLVMLLPTLGLLVGPTN
jgi:hypothetical protein